MPLPNEPFKVFLSHSENNSGLAHRICETLDRLHVRTFAYERYPIGGANRFERIKQEIRTIPFFVALLTKSGLESQWVNQEIGYAVGVGKMPIPILEVDPHTNERLKSRGFVELNDPILLNPKDPSLMIDDLVYTLCIWLSSKGDWADRLWLSCPECGNEFDVPLDYETLDSERLYSWECKCGRSLDVELPGFELKFLE